MSSGRGDSPDERREALWGGDSFREEQSKTHAVIMVKRRTED